MLRMYLLQYWFNLSDKGVEDAIFDSYAFHKFMGINFMEEQVPDVTTLLHFRQLLEESKLGEAMFKAIRMGLEHGGCILHGGTIVDAGSGYVVAVAATPANVHDITVVPQLIREDDTVVYGDSGYIGVEKRAGICSDEHRSTIDYRINRRPGNCIA